MEAYTYSLPSCKGTQPTCYLPNKIILFTRNVSSHKTDWILSEFPLLALSCHLYRSLMNTFEGDSLCLQIFVFFFFVVLAVLLLPIYLFSFFFTLMLLLTVYFFNPFILMLLLMLYFFITFFILMLLLKFCLFVDHVNKLIVFAIILITPFPFS